MQRLLQIVFQPLEAFFNRLLHARRNRHVGVPQRAAQFPDAVRLRDFADLLQQFHLLGHEERIPFGQVAQIGDERSVEAILRKGGVEIAADVVGREIAEFDLFADAEAVHFAERVFERMRLFAPRGLNIGGAVCAENQDAAILNLPRKLKQQVNRGIVRPVQIIHEQHERVFVGHGFEHLDVLLHELFFVPLAIRKLAGVVRALPFEKGRADEFQRLADDRHQLEPFRADFPHDVREFAAAECFIVRDEATDDFDERRVSFALADQFGAFGLGKADIRRLLIFRRRVLRVNVPRLEFVDERRLPDPRLARDKDHRPLALHRLLKYAANRLQILLAPDKCCHWIFYRRFLTTDCTDDTD